MIQDVEYFADPSSNSLHLRFRDSISLGFQFAAGLADGSLFFLETEARTAFTESAEASTSTTGRVAHFRRPYNTPGTGFSLPASHLKRDH